MNASVRANTTTTIRLIQFTAAFEDFLRSFKSSSTEAADALDDLNLDENGADNEYDFMDESRDDDGAQTNRAQRRSKIKYMNILQDVADRTVNNIVIELDDLDQVRRRTPLRV